MTQRFARHPVVNDSQHPDYEQDERWGNGRSRSYRDSVTQDMTRRDSERTGIREEYASPDPRDLHRQPAYRTGQSGGLGQYGSGSVPNAGEHRPAPNPPWSRTERVDHESQHGSERLRYGDWTPDQAFGGLPADEQRVDQRSSRRFSVDWSSRADSGSALDRDDTRSIGQGDFPYERDHSASREPRPRTGFFGKGPKGYVRSDERIREEVCERLSDDDEVDASDVTVSVAAGEVSLEGTVPDRRSKHRAEDIAGAVGGVQDVHNALRLPRSAKTKEEPGR